jgi:hypothetical protein
MQSLKTRARRQEKQAELDGRVFSVFPKKGSEKETTGKHAGPENQCKKTRKKGVGESLMGGI